MDSRRAALIQHIRTWAAQPDELIFVTVIGGYCIALFREDLPESDDALDALIDARLAQRPPKPLSL